MSALLRFLSYVTDEAGVAHHTYVVGGAVRNHLLGAPIKDLNLVVDSLQSGETGSSLADHLQQKIPTARVTTNRHGLTLTVEQRWVWSGHDMRGCVVEIADTGSTGLVEDLLARDFTVDTLMWRAADLSKGRGAPVLDLLGVGMQHVDDLILQTPTVPDRTFGQDPTRMLRALRFMGRYGFMLGDGLTEAILRCAGQLRDCSWELVHRSLFGELLTGVPFPREIVRRLQKLGLAAEIGSMLVHEPGFRAAAVRAVSGLPIPLVQDLLDLGWPLSQTNGGPRTHVQGPSSSIGTSSQNGMSSSSAASSGSGSGPIPATASSRS